MAHDNQIERSNESNEQGKRSKTYLAVVADWMTLFAEMYRDPVTEGTVALYSETLKEVRPEILHKAFLRATKTSKFRPTPAEILECANIELELLQPPKTNYEQISVEEREAALAETQEYRETLREFLRKKDPPKPSPADEQKAGWVGMTPEEEAATLAAYKRYLQQEAAKDEYNRANGIPPIPRSREEQHAIWWYRPRHAQERLRKQVGK